MEAKDLIRIGLIQMRCEKAAMAENLARMEHYYRQAVERGVDIVGFPEMNISGYADPTRYADAILHLDGPEVAQVLDVTRGQPAFLLGGLIEANPQGKPFITQIVAYDGQLVGFYRKTTIKDEEVDWFSPGDGVPVFEHDGLTFGIAICADIDNQAVFAECARQGARIVFELAAPGLYGEQATRDWQAGFDWWQDKCQEHLAGYAKEYGYWIAVATQAGRTIDEDFPGGGYLFAPGGRRAYATPDWSPGAVYLQIDLETQHVTLL
jgi:predicted amidohydrolase